MTPSTDNSDPHFGSLSMDGPPPATHVPGRLRAVMYADAAVTGANGVAYLIGAALPATLLGPASGVLAGLGIFLIAYAVVVAIIGSRRPMSTFAVRSTAIVNLAWVAASITVAATASMDLTGWGRVWAVLQALVVLGFAVLQIGGLRRR